ncbi:MAG: peroxiredoxin [Pseudomonadota bacterium]
MATLTELPKNLPAPIDDGACDHLLGKALPSLELTSTEGFALNLANETGIIVLYCYPMTGRPDTALPDGWDQIPGARGCTPQSCSFRDHYAELQKLQAKVFGISTQSSAYQQEAAGRLHLPFDLLSDELLAFTNALALPTLQVGGKDLIKRVTLIVKSGRIAKVFYPVFPPDQNAEQVIEWLERASAE